jgi:CHAT domain-containing protein
MRFHLPKRYITVLILLLSSSLLPALAVSQQTLQQGQQYFEQGAYRHAIETWQPLLQDKALSTYQHVDLLIRLAAAYQAVGDYSAAFPLLKRAYQLGDQFGTKAQQSLVRSYMGDLLLVMNRPNSAYRYLDKAEALAREANQPEILVHVLNNLGNYFALAEDQKSALYVYEEVAKLAQTLNNAFLHIEALLHQARLYTYQEQTDEAAAMLQNTDSLIEKLAPSYRQGRLRISQGELYLRLHDFAPEAQKAGYLKQAVHHLTQALEQTDDSNLETYAKGYLAQAYTHAKRYDEALLLNREALFSAQEIPELRYRWQWWQGHILAQQENLKAASDAYALALEQLKPIRMGLLNDRSARRIFHERIKPVYYDYADMLLLQAKQEPNKQSAHQLREQAIGIIEELKVAELQDYFADECVTKPRQVRLDTLGTKTAVIYPVLLTDRLEVLLSINGTLNQYTVKVDSKQVTDTLKTFQRNLQIRTRWYFVEQARQLYDWLIKPLKAELNDVETLVIVPDGPFRMIPPSAMYGDKFLIEEFAVVVTPSLNLTEPRALPKDNIQVLLNGLSEGVQNFSPLPSVPDEIKTIRAIFPRNQVLMNQDFLVREVSDSLNAYPYNILHFATHGEFNRDPDKTFLLTYDSKLTLNRLESLLAQEQRENATSIELLTLSACQTAVGDDRAALGLAGVAIRAGARSALASLWFVNDESTSLLMQTFYKDLSKPGVSKAEALQKAQQQLIAHKKFKHPAYWSPFLLIGNWL